MNYKHLLFLLLITILNSCKQETYSLSKIEGKQISITDTIATDKSINDFVKPFRESINKDMDAVLSYAPETYSKSDGDLNTAIGNLMADAVMQESNPIFNKRTGKNIDAVILNHGGIRSIISKGNITTRTAFEIMPFENSIVVVALKGQQIDSMTHYLSQAKRAHPISGIQLTLDKDYNITQALVNKKPIDKDKIYYVATNDYLYNGGDRMRFFKENDSLYTLDYKIRNAMIDYFKKTDTINPVIDNRFIQTK
ncbi:5'-nucleotidase C-terminal domain-containing protein [Olleya marilimosa]|uniref:5'-nucleotidase C-terminal domain-containing protein n=1 Tax=Olleya marilimosa TaxID=272164 RepID=A0ABR8LT20_9FLAO|nr:5'-nucleotidase [Olleya marilimosa]MBD3862254.1 5'-nucleotidase C-terminal domain-containing protein [Olleya marilimosa]MBD3889749.1 5'-nucleotidase C-terminal domain-containing protein [Olleya marilimosa]